MGGKIEESRVGECIKVKNVKAETERKLKAGQPKSMLYLLEASQKLLEGTEKGGLSA